MRTAIASLLILAAACGAPEHAEEPPCERPGIEIEEQCAAAEPPASWVEEVEPGVIVCFWPGHELTFTLDDATGCWRLAR